MGTMDDITALLDDANEQLQNAGGLHDQALGDDNVRRRFRTRVKNVLENQRSALDYLAVGITEKYGTPKGFLYYPRAQAQSAVGPTGARDLRLPGDRKADWGLCRLARAQLAPGANRVDGRVD